MTTKIRIRRAVASALLIAAASAPATAEARFDLEPGGASSAATTQAAPPAPPPGAAGAQPGFDWGDAGIGAAATTLLLGTGALAFAVPRRRRTLSDSA